MLLSAVCVLVVAQSSSEIPEGLMNNPVFCHSLIKEMIKKKIIQHKMCILISVQLLSKTFLILRTRDRDTIKDAISVFM